jgi:hypothetical protein
MLSVPLRLPFTKISSSKVSVPAIITLTGAGGFCGGPPDVSPFGAGKKKCLITSRMSMIPRIMPRLRIDFKSII